eukprot:6189165-Pleurochrysis_carterae.AAC.4
MRSATTCLRVLISKVAVEHVGQRYAELHLFATLMEDKGVERQVQAAEADECCCRFRCHGTEADTATALFCTALITRKTLAVMNILCVPQDSLLERNWSSAMLCVVCIIFGTEC